MKFCFILKLPMLCGKTFTNESLEIFITNTLKQELFNRSKKRDAKCDTVMVLTRSASFISKKLNKKINKPNDDKITNVFHYKQIINRISMK